jgi:hypothetical protein
MSKKQMKENALIIIRAAVKGQGRAAVRKMIENYKGARPDYEEAIKEAFEEFCKGGRK